MGVSSVSKGDYTSSSIGWLRLPLPSSLLAMVGSPLRSEQAPYLATKPRPSPGARNRAYLVVQTVDLMKHLVVLFPIMQRDQMGLWSWKEAIVACDELQR